MFVRCNYSKLYEVSNMLHIFSIGFKSANVTTDGIPAIYMTIPGTNFMSPKNDVWLSCWNKPYSPRNTVNIKGVTGSVYTTPVKTDYSISSGPCKL